MSHTKKERNDAIILIGNKHPDITRVAFYEELESFKWIKICRLAGIISEVQLTFLGKQLFNTLSKNLHPEWD